MDLNEIELNRNTAKAIRLVRSIGSDGYLLGVLSCVGEARFANELIGARKAAERCLELFNEAASREYNDRCVENGRDPKSLDAFISNSRVESDNVKALRVSLESAEADLLRYEEKLNDLINLAESYS